MSSNNIAHISEVDKGLKMKIKRTKIPNKLDSKHEVVKAAVSVAPSGISVNTVSSSSSSVVKPGFSVVSAVTTSRTSASLGSHTIAASVTATLTLPSSTSLTLSLSSLPSSSSVSFASTSLSSGIATTSLVTMAVTNPTVALLKATSVGIMSDGNSAATKPPLKTTPPGAASSDSKDGKSPKAKAAYSKKVKENKMKPDIPVSVGSNMNQSGSSQTVVDSRTCVPMAVGTQPFNSPPPPPPHTSLSGVVNCTLTSEPRPGDTVHVKKENPVHDPYEFNAKVEDKIELPPKKMKLEKADCIETAMSPQPQHPGSPGVVAPPLPSPSQQQQQQPQKRSVGVDVCSVGVVTEPECLGPCEPGTLVGLEGIVWKETDNGLLVVNVTWRGKTYVGTLMDATRYAWAPPRPNGCDSPVSEFESRTPKGRGKRNCRNSAQSSERLPEGRRLRKGRRGTVNSSSSCFTAPPSPAKSDISSNNMKRKTKPTDTNNDKSKRSRSCSRGLTNADSPTPDDYIICPEPNCHKKYKHMNGLRYHRTHAHRKSSLTDDAKDDDEEEEDDDDEKPKKKERTTLSERAERMKAKERMRMSELQKSSDRDSKDSLDDDIPLKEIAIKVSGQTAQRADSAATDKERAEDESCASINDLSSSVATLVTISNTVSTTEATFAKPNISSLGPALSQTTDSAPQAKANDTHVMDVSPCTVPVVPSVTSTAESPQIVASCSSSKTNLPVITCVRSPVHQVSPAVTVSAISRISQANNPHGVAATQTLPSMTCPSIQATTATTVLAVTLSTDRHGASKGCGFLKTITSVRPIVPAPSPQTAGMSSPHLQNSTSQSSPHSHGPTLKPIQPKPTIMGDYAVVSPALSDLSREKSRKVKKKKEKDNMGTVSGPQKPAMKVQTPTRESSHTLSEMVSQDDLYKVDRSAVMRNSTPSKPFDTCSPTSDISKSPFHRCVDSPLLHSPYSDNSALLSGPRLVIPPSTLAVSANVDNKSTISEDIHSPAYSDISDANDSSSPVQQDSPKKDSSLKIDDHFNGPPHLTADGHPLSQHYGKMFYYGASPNYLPHGINPHMASPTLSKGVIKSEYMEESRPSSSEENLQRKKEEARSFQDSELQQKTLIDYYAHLHNISPAAVQYQLNLAGLNPAALESPYTMLAQQSLAAGQKRLLQQESVVKLEDGSSRSTAGLPSSNHPLGSYYEVGRKSKSGFGVLDSSLEQKAVSEAKGQAQRDKNSENLQSLKDSVELKPKGLHHHHHHHHQGLPPQDQHNYQLLKQQNDILRTQMYQQQKLKVFESQRQEKRKGPPELTSAGHIRSTQSPGVVSRHLPEGTTLDMRPDSARKDIIYPNRLDSKHEATDSKRFDIKEESTQPKPSGSSHELSKSRASSQAGPPNIPPTSTISSVPQSLQSQLTSSLPMSLVTPLPTAGTTFPYNPYYPHFRPVQLDTMYRALSPHIIGYAAGPAPGYIHPEQLGYRMSAVEPDRKTADTSESQRSEVPAMVAATAYPPVHKIHELHDKGRPSPGVHSPGPTKCTGGDTLNSPGPATPAPLSEKVKEKQREYTSSPPTQRHVHTHHHTYVVYPPNAAPFAMFGHPAAAAAAAIQTAPHPFAPHPPTTPKS